MVTVRETPFVENPYEVAHWTIRENTIANSWWEVVYSLIGFFVFVFIVRASRKLGDFKKQLHDVFLILFFALFTDLVEFRLRLLLIFDLQYKGELYGQWKYIPTTVTACTIATYLFYAHFLITYVEAIVSIHRFIARILGKHLSILFIYICVGIVFAIKALFLVTTIMYGTPVPKSIYCTRTYEIRTWFWVSIVVWAGTILIAPIFSTITLVKSIVRKQYDSVSAFILVSSLVTAMFVTSYVALNDGADKQGIFRSILWLTGTFQNYRFLLLCGFAAVIVSDIRGAVLATVKKEKSKLFGGSGTPSDLEDEALDTLKSEKKDNFHYELTQI